MAELGECRTSLEEQNHKLHVSNITLENFKDEAARHLRELESSRSRQKELEDSERQMIGRVRELEMTEAVLTTKLSALETEKEHSYRVETDLKCKLDESRRTEKVLVEKIANLERRESALQQKVDQSERRATQLVELLRNLQEMSVQQQIRNIYDVTSNEEDLDNDDDLIQTSPDAHLGPDTSPDSQAPGGYEEDLDNDDDLIQTSPDVHLGPDTTSESGGYDLDRTTKVELLTKVYRLERKCFLQRNRIQELTSELSTFRQTVSEASHRQMDSVLPAFMSNVENKVLIDHFFGTLRQTMFVTAKVLAIFIQT